LIKTVTEGETSRVISMKKAPFSRKAEIKGLSFTVLDDIPIVNPELMVKTPTFRIFGEDLREFVPPEPKVKEFDLRGLVGEKDVAKITEKVEDVTKTLKEIGKEKAEKVDKVTDSLRNIGSSGLKSELKEEVKPAAKTFYDVGLKAEDVLKMESDIDVKNLLKPLERIKPLIEDVSLGAGKTGLVNTISSVIPQVKVPTIDIPNINTDIKPDEQIHNAIKSFTNLGVNTKTIVDQATEELTKVDTTVDSITKTALKTATQTLESLDTLTKLDVPTRFDIPTDIGITPKPKPKPKTSIKSKGKTPPPYIPPYTPPEVPTIVLPQIGIPPLFGGGNSGGGVGINEERGVVKSPVKSIWEVLFG
jgi:hypothetical protein